MLHCLYIWWLHHHHFVPRFAGPPGWRPSFKVGNVWVIS